jgi:hypothetical protein
MLTTLFLSAALAGGPANFCDAVEERDASLLYDFGVSPSSLSGYTDSEVVAGLETAPNDGLLTKIATVRTLLWSNTFAFRLDITGNVPDDAGTWRYGRVSRGRDSLQVIHWQDIDDQSWTVYFDRQEQLCAITYEN